MKLVIGAVKGGVGKSLIATNLTVLSSLHNKRTLLIDADEQGTSGDWTDHRINLGIDTPWTTIRLKGAAVRTEVLKMARDYDNIIIDCGGRDTASLRAALTVADIFLVPFQPKSFDIWTANKVSEIVDEAKCLNDKLISYAFINCANPRGSDNDDAKDILNKVDSLSLLPVSVGMRKAFSNATAEGLAIAETKSDLKAINEIKALYSAIFGANKTRIKRI